MHRLQIGVQTIDRCACHFKQVPHIGHEVVWVVHLVPLRLRRKRDHVVAWWQQQQCHPDPRVQAVVLSRTHAVGQGQRGHHRPGVLVGLVLALVLHERGVDFSCICICMQSPLHQLRQSNQVGLWRRRQLGYELAVAALGVGRARKHVGGQRVVVPLQQR